MTPEGLYTTLLFTDTTWDAKAKKTTYSFVTNRDGKYPAKTPHGMFRELNIPNDLGLVGETIDKYNSGE